MISNAEYAMIRQQVWSNAEDHVANISVYNVYQKLKISVISARIDVANLFLPRN